MLTDPIANMFCAIKNATRIGKKEMEIPASNIKMDILMVMKRHRMIEDAFFVSDIHPKIAIILSYTNKGRPTINEIKRVSKPSFRKYFKVTDLRPLMSYNGFYILNTNQGVISSIEARKVKAGGEVICAMW